MNKYAFNRNQVNNVNDNKIEHKYEFKKHRSVEYDLYSMQHEKIESIIVMKRVKKNNCEEHE